jgi:hypothetical protein
MPNRARLNGSQRKIAKKAKRRILAMPSKVPPTNLLRETAQLPIEPLTVRIPVAVQITGIGRSKLYELISAGDLDVVKIGASTLITMASLRRLIEKSQC